MSARLSTAGMFLAYAPETTADTIPTTGWVKVPEIKSMPSFNPQPNTIQSTTLAETEYHTYVEGLKDLGGALEYGANLTEELITAWATCNTAAATAKSSDKCLWFAVVHPDLDNAIFFQGDPSPIGLNEADVDSMLETTLYVTPLSAPQWATKPTVS